MKRLYIGILALCTMPLHTIATPISKANDPNSIDWNEEACDVILGGGQLGLLAGGLSGALVLSKVCVPIGLINPGAYTLCHFLMAFTGTFAGGIAGAGLGMGAVVIKKKMEFNEYKKQLDAYKKRINMVK
ncbi:MAG TPA: hypothetical protein VGW78_00785 [Candidatus Babeliales bacterium]|jgi:hypothetical protein|nr:hypothetical protein [Candidatus Babeliales bacterium]